MSGSAIHSCTVRRELNSDGYNARVYRKKRLVKTANQMKRLSIGKEHMYEGEEFWKTVVFSDESKLCVYWSDGLALVWGKEGAALNQKPNRRWLNTVVVE